MSHVLLPQNLESKGNPERKGLRAGKQQAEIIHQNALQELRRKVKLLLQKSYSHTLKIILKIV